MAVVHDLSTGAIMIGERLRPLSDDAVAQLMKSFQEVGQVQPITIHSPHGIPHLVTGAHRLAAAIRLGWKTISCVILPDETSDIEIEQIEIAENLHRSDLNLEQRSKQQTRWIELEEVKGRLSQVETATLSDGRKAPPQNRPSGVRAAARVLGIDKSEAHRAKKLAAVAPEAWKAAKVVGLENNKGAMLKVARQPTPERQVAAVKMAAEPLNDIEITEKQLGALMAAWNRAGPEARERFLARIDKPLMDRRYA